MGWLRKGWRLWARALGGKEGSTYEADRVAIWRTLIVLQAGIKTIVDNVSQGLNIPCGCEQRRDALNKMIPYKK